jgi:hypothetical protein
MKKRILTYLAVLMLGVLSYFAYDKFFNKTNVVICESTNTEVRVINSTDTSVVVYLTLGADTNYVTDVNGIFGITTSGLQGFFTLNAGDTISYTSIGKGFSGNLTFGTPPVNCPDTTLFPNGINIFECSLNNNFVGIPNAQETVDISCVSGVNSKIICNLSDSTWNAGGTLKVSTFENSYLYDNVFRTGVFPYGCDSCTVIKNPPICAGHKPFSQPQSKSICNVQRDATLKGGVVYVIFGGFLKGEIGINK